MKAGSPFLDLLQAAEILEKHGDNYFQYMESSSPHNGNGYINNAPNQYDNNGTLSYYPQQQYQQQQQQAQVPMSGSQPMHIQQSYEQGTTQHSFSPKPHSTKRTITGGRGRKKGSFNSNGPNKDKIARSLPISSSLLNHQNSTFPMASSSSTNLYDSQQHSTSFIPSQTTTNFEVKKQPKTAKTNNKTTAKKANSTTKKGKVNNSAADVDFNINYPNNNNINTNTPNINNNISNNTNDNVSMAMAIDPNANNLTLAGPDSKKKRQHKSKASHNIVEKNRRAHLKSCFEGLKTSLPALEGGKASTVAILQEAHDYIKVMSVKTAESDQEIERLKKEREEVVFKLVFLAEKGVDIGMTKEELYTLANTNVVVPSSSSSSANLSKLPSTTESSLSSSASSLVSTPSITIKSDSGLASIHHTNSNSKYHNSNDDNNYKATPVQLNNGHSQKMDEVNNVEPYIDVVTSSPRTTTKSKTIKFSTKSTPYHHNRYNFTNSGVNNSYPVISGSLGSFDPHDATSATLASHRRRSRTSHSESKSPTQNSSSMSEDEEYSKNINNNGLALHADVPRNANDGNDKDIGDCSSNNGNNNNRMSTNGPLSASVPEESSYLLSHMQEMRLAV